MGASPAWKVYTKAGTYEAAAKHLRVAICIVQYLGGGATIRLDHKRILYRMGYDPCGVVGESDTEYIVTLINSRLSQHERGWAKT